AHSSRRSVPWRPASFRSTAQWLPRRSCLTGEAPAAMRVTEFSTGKSYTRSKKLYSTALVRSHRDRGLGACPSAGGQDAPWHVLGLPARPPTAGRHGTDLREL